MNYDCQPNTHNMLHCDTLSVVLPPPKPLDSPLTADAAVVVLTASVTDCEGTFQRRQNFDLCAHILKCKHKVSECVWKRDTEAHQCHSMLNNMTIITVINSGYYNTGIKATEATN